MMFEQLIFYVLALTVIFAGTMVVTVRNPVHAALFLVLAFFGSAGLWLLLEAEFLAIILVLVYVGAVMVLFLFVIMMLDVNIAALRAGFARYLPLGAVVAVLMLAAVGWVVGRGDFGPATAGPPVRHEASYNNTEALGGVLYTDYVLQFEIAAVILLVAIIAAIALALRPSRQTKAPKPEKQVTVRREEHVRLVKMKPGS